MKLQRNKLYLILVIAMIFLVLLEHVLSIEG